MDHLEQLARDFSEEAYMLAQAEGYRRAYQLPKALPGINFSRCLNPKRHPDLNIPNAIKNTLKNIQDLELELEIQHIKARGNPNSDKPHWSYDKNEHELILQCYYGEKAILKDLMER